MGLRGEGEEGEGERAGSVDGKLFLGAAVGRRHRMHAGERRQQAAGGGQRGSWAKLCVGAGCDGDGLMEGELVLPQLV